MTVLFADTSALVKLYVSEPGSDEMAALVMAAGRLALSEITWAEILATLARRFREGRLDRAGHAQLKDDFASDWNHSLIVAPAPTLALVDEILARHALRGADCLQLAAALFLAREGVRVDFACSDVALRAAAWKEGLPVVDPSPPTP